MSLELSERLITHHVGGAWRAPLSNRMRALPAPHGAASPGALVEADAADLARALAAAHAAAPSLAALAPAQRRDLAAGLVEAVAAHLPMLAAARALETGADTAATRAEAQDMLRAMRRVLQDGVAPSASAAAPLAVLGVAPAPPALLGAAMVALILAGRAAVLKPAPRAAIVPLVLMQSLDAGAPALPAGALNLIQGGGAATGAALLTGPGLAAALLAGKPAPRPALAAAVLAAGLPLICLDDAADLPSLCAGLPERAP
jgi:aldehyde dehydrogenase